MTETQLINLDLVDQVVDQIPESTWDKVRLLVVKSIVDNMPGSVIERLTGTYDDFEKAEEVLSDYYKDKTHEIIFDSFKLVGVEPTIYLLDSLNLNSNEMQDMQQQKHTCDLN